MTTHTKLHTGSILSFFALTVTMATTSAFGQSEGGDVVMDALVDEMERSLTLQLEDLQSPYFVQYGVTDSHTHRISATCGAIVSSDDGHSRRLSTNVRVGYYDVDNTNFARGGRGGGIGRRGRGGGGRGARGGMTLLPSEDSYTAIRQAAWLATDSAYKSAIETVGQTAATAACCPTSTSWRSIPWAAFSTSWTPKRATAECCCGFSCSIAVSASRA